MKGLRKKIIVLAAVAALAATSLVGCAGVKDSDIVATVNDSKITVGMANFHARIQQPSYEEYYVSYQDYMQQQMYGSVVQETTMDWHAEQEEGVSLEDTYKDDIMTAVQNIYLSEDHMEEYHVTISDDEMKEIKEAADKFLKANSKEAKEKISADKDTVVEYLRLMSISIKVEQAIKDGVDQKVSDEEAAQKRLRYVSFATTTTDDTGATAEMSKKEIKAVKEDAKEFLEKAKANGSLETYATEVEKTSSTETFGADYEEDTALLLPTEVYKAADALEENGFADIIETDSAIYVVQLESAFDEAATNTEKETIISERETKAVDDAVASWRKDAKIKVYDKVWDKVSMHDIKVTEKVDEEEISTEDITTEEGGEVIVEDGATDETTDEETEETTDTEAAQE